MCFPSLFCVYFFKLLKKDMHKKVKIKNESTFACLSEKCAKASCCCSFICFLFFFLLSFFLCCWSVSCCRCCYCCDSCCFFDFFFNVDAFKRCDKCFYSFFINFH